MVSCVEDYVFFGRLFKSATLPLSRVSELRVMGELEAKLRGGAESGKKDVLEVDVGRLQRTVIEQRREAVCEHVPGTTREPGNVTL